jgi:hypothetical protein
MGVTLVLNILHKIGRSTLGPAVFAVLAVALSAALFAACAPPALGAARTVALSGSWSGLQSDLLDWPSDQVGFSAYIGPFGKSLHLVPGFAAAHDPGKDITSAGASLNLQYMLPAGDRLVAFIEGGVTGTAIRVDVVDNTDRIPSMFDRTTYIRGGFQLGAGVDIALGGNWSVTAAVRGTFLSDIDTRLVQRGDKTVSLGENPSYWELPRIAIVYWY